MGDNAFQVAMTTYLRQPCPIITPLGGRYFGKRGAKVDKYRANLAAANIAVVAPPGEEHVILHDQLQTLPQAIMKLGDILSDTSHFVSTTW